MTPALGLYFGNGAFTVSTTPPRRRTTDALCGRERCERLVLVFPKTAAVVSDSRVPRAILCSSLAGTTRPVYPDWYGGAPIAYSRLREYIFFLVTVRVADAGLLFEATRTFGTARVLFLFVFVLIGEDAEEEDFVVVLESRFHQGL